MNDIAYASNLLKCILFADDTNVTCLGKSINEVNRVMNNKLMYLSDWFKVNKLPLNVEKANCMVFHRKGEVLDPKVVIDDQPIKRMSTLKSLGVIIDEKLSWSDHISNKC